ncbi:MAG: AsmA-like C-terminal region-containing protein [Isosphaeraceae bacterium]|nr:AsmA-like C-terminal region-containing protein [Isosphaeraceae bacterium]
MTRFGKWARWSAGGAAAVTLVVALGLFLGLPVWIRARIEAIYDGPARFGSWRLATDSITLENVELLERGGEPNPWLEIDRAVIAFDWRAILSGMPPVRRLDARGARARIRLDAEGRPITLARIRPDPNAGARKLPRIELSESILILEQPGRPPFEIGGIQGSLAEGMQALELSLTSTLPAWAPAQVDGTLAHDFTTGRIEVSGRGALEITPERARSLPWIPLATWRQVVLHGPSNWSVLLELEGGAVPPLKFVAVADLAGVAMELPTLRLAGEQVRGRVRSSGPVVFVDEVVARTTGGTLEASGRLDFSAPEPSYDLTLGLESIDAAQLADAWKIDSHDVRGHLNGSVALRASIEPEVVDFSGTRGSIEVVDGLIDGFPLASCRLSMKASANPESTDMIACDFASASIDLTALADRFSKRLPRGISGVGELRGVVELPASLPPRSDGANLRGRWMVSDAAAEGLSIRTAAGNIALTSDRVKLDGIEGDFATPMRSLDPGAVGPPRPSRFQGSVSAETDGRVQVSAEITALDPKILLESFEFDGMIPGGELDLSVDAEALTDQATRLEGWKARGQGSSARLELGGRSLESIAFDAELERGILRLSDVFARIEGIPTTGQGRLELTGERGFEVDARVRGVSMLDALRSSGFRASGVEGTLDAHATLNGRLDPLQWNARGEAGVGGLVVRGRSVGDLSVDWHSEGEAIVFGEVRLPKWDGAVLRGRINPKKHELRLVLSDFDLSRAAAIGGPADLPAVDGRLGGTIDLVLEDDLARLRVASHLDSERFLVEGVDLGPLVIDASTTDAGLLNYAFEIGREGRRTRFDGSLDLAAALRGEVESIESRWLSAGYTAADLRALAGIRGAAIPASLGGRFGIDANTLVRLEPNPSVGIRGFVEGRDLTWGSSSVLGRARGTASWTEEFWRVDDASGELFGGALSGSVGRRAATPDEPAPPVAVELRLDRAPIARLIEPWVGTRADVSGFASIAVSGRTGGSTLLGFDIAAGKANLFGIPSSELRGRVELALEADGKTGSARLRRYTGRIAGGSITGSASARLGTDQSISAQAILTNIDLETIARRMTTSARPGSGKVSGRIDVEGPRFEPTRMRGRIELDLDDASLVEIPILSELERFLGSARGGLIEDGDLRGTLTSGRLQIDSLTLVGRLFQIHASGIVELDGRLAIDVFVNTNQLIPETGQALVSRIPGLAEVLGRREESRSRAEAFLSARLMKFRIGGTLRSPAVRAEPGASLTSSALGFFAGVLELPLGLAR